MATIEGLKLLINKEPVVATHVGIFDSDSAENTYHRYRSEKETFVVSPDIHRYQRQFIQTILDQQTTIGCLVAPFGYGKTSTAISIWNACEEANLLAIPPFSCNSIAEMGHAIATALIYRFESLDNIKMAEQVRQAFNQYLISSAKKLAEQDTKNYGISPEIALQSIEDKIKSGHLQLEASATHLLSFLEELVAFTIEVGFKGLVVIVDEFQQFLGNVNKGVITNFRTLIWGLQTRGELPLGFLITMDPDTERNLTDRGADILHRIRNHGLYLAFSNISDREFPRELWSSYADNFGFKDNSSSIVDRATLDAIGQICERSDLSNGPRTVINVFQRIATLRMSREHTYSPIDLINDFLTGDIRFDGDRGKIASLVNEIISYDYIRRSHERVETIKLIAAFPRGCPPEVADRYSLRDTYNHLHDELQGEILVELPEGIALVDLQNVGKPPNKLNIILKKYWLQITEEEIISDKALEYFAKYGVSPLFPEYSSHQNGWKPETDRFFLTSAGGYFRAYEGTFFEEYPRRRIAVQVCFEIDDVVIPEDYVDAQFIFLIQRYDDGEMEFVDKLNSIPTYIIPVAVHKKYSRHLPRDIREIENFLSPVVITPGVIVSLLNYITEQVPKIEGMSEQEHQRIMDTHMKLQEFLLTMSISDETFEPYGIKIYSRGAQAFRDALFNILRNRYPNYQTVMTGPAWQRNLEQYRQALHQVDSPQRRGIEPLTGSKPNLASLFEQRQYAGFESYIKQYGGLIEITDWRGDSGSIVFNRHPQENDLIEAISLNSGMIRDDVYAISREQGYLYDETSYFIDFLLLRGYIEVQKDTERFVLASTFTQDELITMARRMFDETKFIMEFPNSSLITQLQSELALLLSALEAKAIDLSDAQIKLLQHQRFIQSECKQLVTYLRTLIQGKIEQLYKYKARLDETLPESKTETFLDSHVNGARKLILSDVVNVSSRIQKRIAAMRETLELSIDLDSNDFSLFENYAVQVQNHLQLAEKEIAAQKELLDQCDLHRDWVQLVDRLKRIRDMAKVAGKITDTQVLEKNIDNIQWSIQQELASEGLKHYRLIYNNFISSVNEMQREIETLARLAETQSRTMATSQASVSEQVESILLQREPTMLQSTEPQNGNGKLQDEPIDLGVMFEESGSQEIDFLRHLVDLNKRGEILIYWRKK